MKCPNCGAEVLGNFCEYCGSEKPRENNTINITNNYYGNATPKNNGNIDNNFCKCPKCGGSEINFERERVGTTTQSDYRKKYIGKGRKGQSVSQNTYRTVGICRNCGYTWNPNATTENEKPKRKTWLWVLGWIFIFPVPLTILMLRNKEMKPALKYGIIAAAWIFYFLIGMFGNTETNTPPTNNPPPTEIVQNEQVTVAYSDLDF